MLLQHLPHRRARDRIEARRRLVEEEHARLVHEAARDLHAPAHAAREILDLLVLPLQELDRLEQLGNQLRCASPRHAVQLRVDQQVLLDAQLEVARHRLRDDADGAPHVVRLLR